LARNRAVLGWTALALSALIAAVWAYWGIAEAFHEGWWAPTLGGRLFQTVRYLVPAIFCVAIGALALSRPRLGGTIYVAFGIVFSLLVFRELAPEFRLQAVLSWLPVTVLVIGVGLLWLFGEAPARRPAGYVLFGVPLLVVVIAGAYPAYRVGTRLTDVSPDARLVVGNGVSLVWAPAGPGWVRGARNSASWVEAVDICSRLSEDGRRLLDQPQNVWRLPTVEEAVRSMARHGENSGGVWDPETGRASYAVQPDKEPPLWDPLSETIYWWTATEAGKDEALVVTYDGNTWSDLKTRRLGSRGFRAVRERPGVPELEEHP